jgi:outer membrane protein assembly factor BamB
MVFASGIGEKRLLIVEGPQSGNRLRWLVLADSLAAPPQRFGDAILVPGQIGQLTGVDARTGGTKIQPFQPRLQGTDKYLWGRPLVLDDGDVVVADGLGRVYLLTVDDVPQPHFVSRKEIDMTQPLVSPLAALGQSVLGVDAGGVLRSISLPDFEAGPSMPLGAAQVAWGPDAIGGRVYLTTDDDMMWSIDEAPSLAWQQPLPHGPLAGRPLAVGGTLICASRSGFVYAVAADSGDVQGGEIDLGEPLAAGPQAWGSQILLTGYDGNLHVIASLQVARRTGE